MSTPDHIIAYVQSRLSLQDRATFEAELEQDQDLRAEVAAMVATRFALTQDAILCGDDLPNEGWRRLLDKIDQVESSSSSNDAGKPANDNRVWSLTLLQVACVALLSVLGWQTLQTAISHFGTSGFEMASTAGTGPMLQISFAKEATLGDVSALLLDLDGWIVGGPSALGLYSIAFEDAGSREAAFSALSESDNLILNVFRN